LAVRPTGHDDDVINRIANVKLEFKFGRPHQHTGDIDRMAVFVLTWYSIF